MSSIESASMPGTEVSEKTPVDFGAKAVSLKTQNDSSRLLQSTGPIRAVSTGVSGNSRPPLGVNTTYTPTPLSSISSQKAVTRVTATTIQTSISTMGSLTRPPLPVTAVSSGSHVTTSYHVPRGPAQVSNIASRPNQGRSFVTLQPVGISSAPTTGTSFVPAIRTSSPSTTAPRVPSPMQQSSNWTSSPANNVITVPRCISPITAISRSCSIPSRTLVSTSKTTAQQQLHRSTEAPRPLLLHAAPQKPVTLTQVTQSAASSTTVLTTPVRLNVSTSQPPLISTQRVAMSATPGTVLTSRISVPAASSGNAQTVSVSGQPRIPTMSQGTVIAASSRIGGSGAVSQATTVIPAQTRLVAGQNTILATPARIGTQIVSGQSAVLAATARIASAGTTVLSTSKPTMTGAQTAVMTTATRMPAMGVIPSHQPATTRGITSTAASSVTRFTVSTPVSSTRSTTSITNQITTATTSSRLTSTSTQSSGIVVHPQIMVNATKSAHGTSHITNARPVQIHSAGAGQKVITQALHGPIQITQSPVNIATSKVITQPSQNSAQTTITTTVASKSSLVCTSSSLASTNAPTLSTYTLPGGASYFYEAPSGYQLATDAPLVARPLSPDTPLVSRQLSSEGPLIARPFTPGNSTFVSQTTNNSGGLIATPQHMRFNSVMIVDQASVAVQPNFSSESSTLMISDSSLTSVSKLNSSPRPSILRKRDNEASPAKATKNLTPILTSASVTHSASPSPPSLHVDTNQQSNDHGPSSNGSTTISATSSPGPDDPGENIMPVIKTEFSDDVDRPPVEMSPRKKPRKQLLNDANDAIEMEFISDGRIKKEREEDDVSSEKVYLVKRPNVSLLHSYKHNWKSRHNHFLRYSDVKPKDERRPTVTDLANQKQVVQKVNGWKIYHLSTQMEDLSEMESHVLERLSTMLQTMDRTICKDIEKDVNRVNDLIMGNIQRSKVIKDQMQEAKTQMMKVFDHKAHVSEIIGRCASKRNFKKREKY